MNSSNYRFTLDMHSAQSQISLPALLGDTGRTLYISFSDGGKPYFIADGCLAKLSIKRPTGTTLEEFCTIENNTTMVYPFSKNKNTCAVAGIHNCDVTLYAPEGKKITSAKFTMVVSERAINRDDIDVTDEDYTAVDAILAVEAARQVAEAERTEAEAERLSAEEERQRAEIERISAESERSISEEERKTAESNRAAKDIERDNKIANAVAASTHAVSVSTDAKEVVSQLSEDVAGFRTEIGNESLIFDQDTIKGAVNLAMNNAVAAKGQSDDNRTALVSLSAQVAGVARTYVIPDFRSFINFLNALYSVVLKEDRDGDGVEEIYNIYVTDLITGDNIIITETNVPDFWFEKNSALTSFESYTYSGVQYNLNASVNGATIGAAHILETDYSVIEEHASSASASASSAATSEAKALQSKNDAKAASDKAKASEVAAKESETAAASSATQAKNSADVAKAAEANVMNLEQRVSRNDKRITNIERGSVPEAFETDSSVAYTKDVPAEALPYAEVNTLGGMTRKCTNLLPFPYALKSGTYAGLTITVNNDGSVKIVGTATADAFLKLADMDLGTSYIGAGNGNGEYLLSDCVYTGSKTVVIIISVGNSYDKTYYPMIQTDKVTASPWEPYFEGLRSAPTEAVESVGVNMLNPAEILKGYYDVFNNGIFVESVGGQWRASGKMPCYPSTYYTLSNITLSSGYWVFFDNGDNLVGYSTLNQSLLTVQTPANCTAVAFYCNMSGDGMLNKGSTAQPYRPYARNALPIPEAVQALDGYGEGVNESVHTYIDFEKKQFVKRVGKVDLGTLNWMYSIEIARFGATIQDIRKTSNIYEQIAISTLDFNTHVFADSNRENGFCIFDGILFVRNADYTDAASFKAAMSGVMLVYELATPEVTDISDILPADNYIGVEGGGTLTFKNQFEFDVPSEVTYQIKKEATV